ncbi:MAG TPA: hypothetical protein VIS04_03130 [Woeseiaceae bacterium]
MTTHNWRSLIRNATHPGLVALAWFGMSASVALLAVPAVFSSGLDRPLTFIAARSIFVALNQAELIALILLLVTIRFAGLTRSLWHIAALLALMQIAQASWLLPQLSERTDMIVSGMTPPPSAVHALYSGLHLAKLLLLLFIGLQVRRNGAAK